MAARLIIGRAGTGKTALCAREIRAVMARDPLGPPLLWIVPEQGTFAAERLLLTTADRSTGDNGRGTFRTQVLSFRRLAMIIAREVGVFAQYEGHAGDDAGGDGGGVPKPMDEVARAVLLEETVRHHRSQLTVFATVADRPGFLQKLDTTLRELRQHGHTGATLRALLQGPGAERFDLVGRRKLLDLAVLLDAWAQIVDQGSGTWDFEHIMHQAALKVAQAPLIVGAGQTGQKARIWVDAFSTLSALEMRMLAGLALAAEELTITLLADPDSPALRDLRQTRAATPDDDAWGLFTRTERLHRRLIDTFRQHQVPLAPTVALRQTHRFLNPALARVEAEALDDSPPLAPPTSSAKAAPTLFDAPECAAQPEVPSPSASTAPPQPNGVEIWESSDPETEVHVAAQTIRQLTLGQDPFVVQPSGCESGPNTQAKACTTNTLRYRQIAVIVPELDETSGTAYQDAIRRIFAQHGIPHFIDQRRSIGHHPLVELLKSAVALVSSRFQRDELLLLLKTQLVGITEEEVSLLENYVIEHGITGGFGSEAWSQPWTWLAPNQEDEDEVPQSTRERLARVNAIRERTWTSLQTFAEALAANPTTPKPDVPDGARFPQALRQLLITLKVEKRLHQWIESARRAHDLELVQVHEQVWREVDHLLTLLESLLTGRPRSLGEFERLLATALQNLTLGLIPPTVDQVLVSGVTRSRVPEMEVVLLLGAVEGQFPKVVPEDPILSDAQREAFNASAADPIGEGSDRQLLEMPFFDYVALTRARRQLIISYPLADRQGKALGCSRHIERLRDLLPDQIKERKFDASARTSVDRLATVDDLLASITTWIRTLRTQGTDTRNAAADFMPAVYNWLVTAEPLAAARQLVWQGGGAGGGGGGGLGGRITPQLSPALAARFYPPGTNLRMSVSQLEKFAACPLQYFLLYTLGLRPRKEFALDQLSLGQLLHRILERIYRRIINGDIVWPDCPPDALRRALDIEADAAIAELHAEIAQNTPGYEKTRARIKRTLGIMLEADRRRALQGDLRPAAVELEFGRSGANVASRDKNGRLVSLPVLAIPIRQHTLQVNGKIDRMDAGGGGAHEEPVTVIDYKSSAKKSLELFRIYSGLALQLPVYALVVQELAARQAIAALYIALGMKRESVDQQSDAPLPDSDESYQKFKPRGLVDADQAWRLDRSLHDTGDKRASTWFNLKFNKDGSIPKTPTDLLAPHDFQALLSFTRHKVATLAEELTAGTIAPLPYRHQQEIPCDYCEYQSLCPFDPARDPFREIAKLPIDQLLQRMRDALAP